MRGGDVRVPFCGIFYFGTCYSYVMPSCGPLSVAWDGLRALTILLDGYTWNSDLSPQEVWDREDPPSIPTLKSLTVCVQSPRQDWMLVDAFLSLLESCRSLHTVEVVGEVRRAGIIGLRRPAFSWCTSVLSRLRTLLCPTLTAWIPDACSLDQCQHLHTMSVPGALLHTST